ncbi:Transcription factor MADS-box superfamily [Arabidopsis suecica]|uniref:Transcription factor MADS-box superfamily n=1 Tax=Arabidopsis suecica TaxID=45249 RepID=A0A8T1ZU55_ARASU|nr:Transcription factor MADS-box superfamily [Arabidopsis suecica]
MPSSKVSECTMRKRGTKRKIEIEKRITKQQRSVACSKRRPTLFSKAADLCLLSGANIAVFVTSPDENSDVVYSFSGYSHASEIVDCYLNGKSPPKITNTHSKLGFWWEDPDLYCYCDDLSELSIIEDRMMRTKKHLMDCLEKKEKSQFVSKTDQNPNTDEIFNNGRSSSCSSQIASDLGQNPSTSSPSSSQIVSFDQNSYSSLEKIYGEPTSSQVTCFDQNPIFSVGGESSCDHQSLYLVNEDPVFVNCLCETEEENNGMSVPQETQTQSILIEDQSFWENLLKDDDDVFGLLNDNNEEDEFMIDISEFLSEEEEFFVSSNSSTKVGACGNDDPHGSRVDGNFSGYIRPRMIRPVPRIGETEESGKYWHLDIGKEVRGTTQMQSRGYCSKRSYYLHHHQRSYPIKKRKYFDNISDSNSDDYRLQGKTRKDISAGNRTISARKSRNAEAADQVFQGVPELFLEIPETATVGSLKRMVMEAVTTILGDGLRVRLMVQGKKKDVFEAFSSGLASPNWSASKVMLHGLCPPSPTAITYNAIKVTFSLIRGATTVTYNSVHKNYLGSSRLETPENGEHARNTDPCVDVFGCGGRGLAKLVR